MPEGDERKWYAFSKFNLVESYEIDLNYKTASLHIGYVLKRNIRLAGNTLTN